MNDNTIRRSAGAPSSAIPGMIGFGFLVMFAPCFFSGMLLFIYVNMYESKVNLDLAVNGYLGSSIAWIIITTGGVLGPARYGKIWAIRLMRMLSYPALAYFAVMFVFNIFLYFYVPPSQNGLEIIFLFILYLPLALCAWFLIRALRHEPWFDPKATVAQIGPSRGTDGDFIKAAGLDQQGHLPAAERAAVLAMGPPPARWLCYVAPPYVAARLHHWWWFALTLILCLAALVFAIGIPLRSLIVYVVMGGLADRLRTLQLVRQAAAAELPPPRRARN